MRVCALLLALACAAADAAQPVRLDLKAGAARVDITPPIEQLPAPYKTIYDPIFVRALVVDNGATRAAIVIADVPAIQAGIFADLARKISAQANVPLPNVVLGATHTHNSIRVDTSNSGGIIAGSDQFTSRVSAAALEAVRQATARLQPARAGYATGKAWLTSNRNEWSASQHRFIDGIDRSGTQFVDPTLGVLAFDTLSGTPIAFLLNYGIEPVVNMGGVNEISGDVPGAASRHIERRFGDSAVALFTIAPAASPSYRVWGNENPPREAEAAHRIMSAMGTILGEEALAVAAGITLRAPQLRIAGTSQTLQCPGKITTPQNLPNQCAYTADSRLPACDFKDRATEPVTLTMGLLKLGDVALVQADANVVPAVGERLRRAAPPAHTMIALLNFGPFRFLVDDASFPLNTYEATATRAQRGCGEDGFVAGVLQMMQQVEK